MSAVHVYSLEKGNQADPPLLVRESESVVSVQDSGGFYVNLARHQQEFEVDRLEVFLENSKSIISIWSIDWSGWPEVDGVVQDHSMLKATKLQKAGLSSARILVHELLYLCIPQLELTVPSEDIKAFLSKRVNRVINVTGFGLGTGRPPVRFRPSLLEVEPKLQHVGAEGHCCCELTTI
ncbi:hypothetical protein GQ43DRAFT_468032 [Delitschia confertaspora ATCC 74209]|uniref:Uncharacterized protein n=1 Tax=Delitschia confertaspora ATCC 74209 TaxID=1513339 RepID=A0A9P4JUW4_9PLEO|nr:hypothetical protein GQ43DRAFT_468032 [Delitschia confertaspora ATCC 74209]